MTEELDIPRYWQLHRLDLKRDLGELEPFLVGGVEDLAQRARLRGARHGQGFVLGPDGRPDPRVNACLTSAKWRNLGRETEKDYSYSLVVWLNFLHILGAQWWEATEDHAEEFLFWRVTDPANGERIQTSSFSRDLAGLKKFYRWVGRKYGIANPFEDFDAPPIARRSNVKWFDPAGFARWLDLGIRGMDLDGRPDQWWRGRNEQRDTAFCQGLYGNGLRVAEWASVVIPELPHYDRRRHYYACHLADACAKKGYGHPYWTPQSAIKGVLSYMEGPRAAAVRRAQQAGRYERVQDKRTVLATHGTDAVTLERPDGGSEKWLWNDVGKLTRLRLFRRTEQGLEPVALWLNEDGLPRVWTGWEHTFKAANERIEGLGLEGFVCSAHMLRHSCALKWYSIGKLVRAAQLGHLDEEERADFREEFGSTWHLVQTMLGHRSVETTKEVYLEPFRILDVEVLLAHAEGFPVAAFMSEVFANHPRVHTDPLAVIR
ncbi:site-specific integrase [Streptomyces mirabilis]|uniref:site-specific integrase n=1 Tax=Streptomyces mirabilis TaxID=68239 RepID=UPI0036A30261